MKKILTIIMILLCFVITGCNKKDNFEHYDLKDKDLNTYVYHGDEKDELYALADIIPEGYESFITGLFYKVSENDYILLEKLEYSRKDAYKNKTIYHFYENKLYGVGNGDSPMIFEIELNGKQSKMNELKFKINNKTNPFLITSIEDIKDNKILYYGYVTTDSGNNSSNIKCSLKTYECTIDK